MASNPTNPDHYSRWEIQPWDFISQNNLDFMRGNIIKYIMRYDAKNGLEDLKKARVYLDKMINNLSCSDDVQYMWIMSLYHITQKDNKLLTENAFNPATYKGSRYIYRHEAGFFIAVDKNVEYPVQLSNHFLLLLKECENRKFAWLNLERETAPHGQFPAFEW